MRFLAIDFAGRKLYSDFLSWISGGVPVGEPGREGLGDEILARETRQTTRCLFRARSRRVVGPGVAREVVRVEGGQEGGSVSSVRESLGFREVERAERVEAWGLQLVGVQRVENLGWVSLICHTRPRVGIAYMSHPT
eukprot:3456169-Rhodomonas_salina.4